MAGYIQNLKAVEDHLDQDETIQYSCWGTYNSKCIGLWLPGILSKRKGILLVTEKRAMIFGKKLFGYDLESFPLCKITAIEMSVGMIKQITLRKSRNSAYLTSITQGLPNGVVNYIRENMGETAAVPASAPAEDIPAQIQKLAALKDQGILTEEEFTSKKAELLARM